MKIALLVFAITLQMDACAGQALSKQRQEAVDLCEKRGGVPVLDQAGTYMERCDFPPRP